MHQTGFIRAGTHERARQYLAGAVAADVAALPQDATTESLLAIFYDEILRDYPRPTLAEAAQLGAEIDARIRSFTQIDARNQLRAARDERGCKAAKSFLGAPIIPDLACQ